MKKEKIGVISDTHGLLRPEAITALAGVEMILHAGDVGKPDILKELEQLAPVVAVSGNIDKGEWASSLPKTEVIEWKGKTIYMLHILDELDLDPKAAHFDMVIYGHSHKPSITTKEDVIYMNPGSSGPRRFKLPITVGIISFHENNWEPKIIHLPI